MGLRRLVAIGILSVLASPAAAQDWAGWYAGFNIGANGVGSCDTLTPQGQASLFPVETARMVAIANGCGAGMGLNGGVDVGVNNQSGRFVTGIEADLSAVGGTANVTHSGLMPSGNTVTFNMDSSISWLATIRGRAGVVENNNTLIYATGGLAIAQVNGRAREDYVSPGGANVGGADGTGSSVVAGWTLGVGAEMKLQDDWSVKLEALYADLGSMNYEASYRGGLQPFYADNFASKTGVGIIRVGLNHSFGPSGNDEDSSGDTKDWSGFYAGVYGGGNFARSHADGVDLGNGTWSSGADHWNADATGVSGGVEAGVNMQSGILVAGLEADLGYLGGEGRAQSPLGPGATYLTSTGGPDFTLRGRLGIAAGKALFYGTAGVIVADVGASVAEPYIQEPDLGAIFTSKTGLQAGWIAGGGVEYALEDNWSVKAEAMVYDLGTKRVSGDWMNPPAPPESIPFGWDVHNTGVVVRLGVNKGF